METQIGRNPFARHSVVRCLVPRDERGPCEWCGLGVGRFRYVVDPDAGRRHTLKGAFCSKGCCESYHDGKLD